MIAEVQPTTSPQESRKRGRPRGQFNYHKLVILSFLQTKNPFVGTNEDLATAIGEWGQDSWRVSVSSRQLARYLRALQEETLEVDGSRKSRIEISLRRTKTEDGWTTVRQIQVNDTKVLDLA